MADDLNSIPVSPSSNKTPEERSVMSKFFGGGSAPQGEANASPLQDQPPSTSSKFDWKFIGVATLLFILLANPWIDALIGKMPKCESSMVVMGIKGVLFLLLLVVAIWVMKK